MENLWMVERDLGLTALEACKQWHRCVKHLEAMQALASPTGCAAALGLALEDALSRARTQLERAQKELEREREREIAEGEARDTFNGLPFNRWGAFVFGRMLELGMEDTEDLSDRLLETSGYRVDPGLLDKWMVGWHATDGAFVDEDAAWPMAAALEMDREMMTGYAKELIHGQAVRADNGHPVQPF